MSFSVIKRQDGTVELRIQEDGGGATIWLCENEQEALFRLASLLFSPEKPPKEGRSILVGTFRKKEEERPVDMEELAKKLAEELKKEGLVPETFPAAPKISPAIVPIGPWVSPSTGDPYDPNYPTITWTTTSSSTAYTVSTAETIVL